MTECFTWSQTSDKSITGLCSMELQMETVRNMRNGCPVCVRPIQDVGDCSGCPIPPAATYRVLINGVSSLPIDSSSYNREFLVYQAGGCIWHSRELELGVWRNPTSYVYETVDPETPYPGSTIVASGFAPRIVLTAGRTYGGVLKTTWSVELRWRNLFFSGSSTAFIVRYVLLLGGNASKIDCYETVTGGCVNVSRNANGGGIGGGEVGQFDPWLNGFNPNTLPPYTFTVRPL